MIFEEMIGLAMFNRIQIRELIFRDYFFFKIMVRYTKLMKKAILGH